MGEPFSCHTEVIPIPVSQEGAVISTFGTGRRCGNIRIRGEIGGQADQPRTFSIGL